MKKVLILGSGAGGTMMAAKLRKELNELEWSITILDNDEMHHYQPGWLFIPFGIYTAEDCMKPKRDFIPKGVDFILDEVVHVDPDKRQVQAKNGAYEYDYLVIATGCRIAPEEVEGLEEWTPDPKSSIHTFFTLESAVALYKKIKYFKEGRLVFNIAEMPHKCPVVPVEFVFMADWFFTVNGVRDKVEIEFVTPLDNVFTKPVAAKALAQVAAQKKIKVTPYFDLAQVNAKDKTIESHKGEVIGYDLLVAIPPNMGDKALIDSGISDPVGFVSTNNETLQADGVERVYVVGDTTNVPTSKAGSKSPIRLNPLRRKAIFAPVPNTPEPMV